MGEQLEKVTQNIYKLTKNMYNANRLKVNDSKNQLLQVEANTGDGSDPNRQLIKVYDDQNKLIKAQSTMKSLGFMLNSRCTLDSHLSSMKSRIGLEYSKLKPYLNLMTQEDRKLIVNSKLRSVLDYGIPLYMGETEGLKSKLESSYMTINRIIHGGLTFKVNNVKICKRIS